MSLELRGKPLADALKNWCAEKITELNDKGAFPPGFAIVQVGDDAGSMTYLQQKVKSGEKLGMSVRTFSFPDSAAEKDVAECLYTLNNDSRIDGIFMEHPLPEGWEARLRRSVQPSKDAEGLHPLNLGRLYLGEKGFPVPCTAEAVVRLLEWYELDRLAGLSAAVMGRSISVGRAVTLLLLEKNATVSTLHSRSRGVEKFLGEADLVVTAIGKARAVDSALLKPGCVLVDVGTNVTSQGTLVGDATMHTPSHLRAFSPVPGGVGPVTVSVLLANVVRSALVRASCMTAVEGDGPGVPSTEELRERENPR